MAKITVFSLVTHKDSGFSYPQILYIGLDWSIGNLTNTFTVQSKRRSLARPAPKDFQ